MRNVYEILAEMLLGKIQLGRPMRTWEDNIKMDCKEIGLEGVCWIHLAQDRKQWQNVMIILIKLLVP
jgi:hypothetical protein